MRKFKSTLLSTLLIVTVTVAFNMGLAESKEIKTLRLLNVETYPPTLEVLKEWSRDFSKLHPDVKIRIETVPEDKQLTKVVTSIAAGYPYEVVGINLYMAATLADKGYLEPITDIIKANAKGSPDEDYFPNTRCVINGEDYAASYRNVFMYLWFRKDLFAEKGLRIPTPTASDQYLWEEYHTAAEKLTEDFDGDGRIDRYGIAFPLSKGDLTQVYFSNLVWAADGQFVTMVTGKPEVIMDRSPNRETIKKVFDFMKDETKWAPAGISEYGNYEVIRAFTSAATAMSVYPGRLLTLARDTDPKLADVTGAMAIPHPKGSLWRFRSQQWNKGYTVMKSKYVKEAKEFVAFVTNEDNAYKIWNTVPFHLYPPLKSAYEKGLHLKLHPVFGQKHPDKAELTMKVLAPYGKASHLPDGSKGNVFLQSGAVVQSMVFADMVQGVILLELDPDEQINICADKVREILGEKPIH